MLNRLKKSGLFLLVMMVMLLTVFTGCSSSQSGEENNTSQVAEGAQTTDNNEVAFNATIVDSTETTITLAEKPERIVSMAPSTTEILYFLGLEDQIVGRTKYCTFPETIADVQEIGGTSNPNVEAIIDLNPDLVVGATHVSEEIINKLREVGITVAFLNESDDFEGTYSAIEKLGILTGTEDKAAEVIADMKQKVEDITAQVSALNKEIKPRVYYSTGFGEGDYGAGGDTFIGEIITLAGGENIMQDIEGWSISKEQIAQGNPEIIIGPTGIDIDTEMAKTDFYKDLEAVKAGNVYEIDGDMISRQGPRVADALVEMAKVINPELQ